MVFKLGPPFSVVHDDRGIVNAKNFKAEMEAKTAKHKFIKEEIPSPQESPELKPTKIKMMLSPEYTQIVAKRSLAQMKFETECQRWHDAVVASSKRMVKLLMIFGAKSKICLL